MKQEPKHAIALENGDDLTDNSWEIARIWITNNAGSHVWVAAWALDDPRSFGHLMADTIRHGARAYASTYGLDEQETLQAIVDGVGEELREQFDDITTIEPGSLHS
jgi:hypothetical protein